MAEATDEDVHAIERRGALREVEFRPNLLDDGRLLLTVLDVTDSRRSEEALRASEAKFRALFQDSGVGIALVDQTGDIFDVNPAMESLLKANRQELRLRAFEECLVAEDLPAVQGAVSKIMDGGDRAVEVAARLQLGEGEPVSTRLNVVVVRDPSGDPMFTAYFAHDVTEQRRATAELEESQEQNRALLEATPDLLFLLDKKGTVEDYVCSAEFPIKVGDAVVGSDLRKVVPQLRDTLDGQLEQVADSQSVVKSKFTAGGHRFETRLVRSGEGNRVMVIRDQTEPLQQREVHRNPGSFDVLGGAVIAVDGDGVVTEWNTGAADLFGIPRAEALGRHLATFYGMEDAGRFLEEGGEGRGFGGGWGMDAMAIARRDGTTVEAEVRLTPLELDAESEPMSYLVVHRDLAQEVKEEAESEPGEGMMKAEAVYQKITNNLQIIYSLLNLQVTRWKIRKRGPR